MRQTNMMKKVFFPIVIVAVVATMVSCGNKTAKGGDNDSTAVADSIVAMAPAELCTEEAEPSEGASTEQDKEAARAFVEKFYKEWSGDDILDYAYPKKHITPKLLKYLADSYDFDCEGECLATWKFFYEGGGDVGQLKSRQITARDGNHVLVQNQYENYKYDVLLTVVKDGDTFKIDNLKQERSEYVDANN